MDKTSSSFAPPPDRFIVRPVRVGPTTRQQDTGARRAQGRRAGCRARKLHAQVSSSQIHDGRRVGGSMLNRIIDATLAYRWLVLVAILALLGVGGYALYTIPVEAFPDLTNNQVVVVTEAPAAAHRGGATRHLSDRARDARPAEQGGSPVAVEARALDGDDCLRRFGADVFGAPTRGGAAAADLVAAAARHAAPAGAAGHGVRRVVSVHALRSDERDGAEGSARVGHQGATAHASRRQRNQRLGRADETVSDRGRSGAADAVWSDACTTWPSAWRKTTRTSAAATSSMPRSNTRCSAPAEPCRPRISATSF